jgi:charged multivesicular body protein 6
MGILFSFFSNHNGDRRSNNRSKNQPVVKLSNKDETILELKRARDKLAKYKSKLEAENDASNTQIKQMLRENKKQRALLVLKVRKYKDDQLVRIDGELLQVHEMISNIEWAAINVQAVKAMQLGVASLQSIHAMVSPEDIQKLLLDNDEAMQVSIHTIYSI